MYTEKPSLLLKYTLIKNTEERANQLRVTHNIPRKEPTREELNALISIKKRWNQQQ